MAHAILDWNGTNINLIATDGSVVNLPKQKKKTVVYCYPMTGKAAFHCQKVGMKFQALEVHTSELFI